MSELPIEVTAEGPEAHPPKVGHKLIDMIVAGTAILISIISLFVAVSHGRTMEKLVAANSWPLLRYDTGNFEEETKSKIINLTIENAGVGPALVKSFHVFFDGKPVEGQAALLLACCGPAPAGTSAAGRMRGNVEAELMTSDVANTVIRAGERRHYVKLADTSSVTTQWEALNRARFKLTFDVCYCSVLGDCWRSDLTGVDARPVNQCPAEAAT